jgi:hypothetical protein
MATVGCWSTCTPAGGIAKISSLALTAAVLDVLFSPYNKENGREFTYNQRRVIAKDEDGGNGKRRWPLIALVPIDQPDDFDCLGLS